jgi:hypothetical protein
VEEDVSVLLKYPPADAVFSCVTFQLVGLMDADWISWTTDLIESNGEAGVPTYSKDYTVPTSLTVVKIFQPPGDPAEKLSAPISFPAIDFEGPTPVTVVLR